MALVTVPVTMTVGSRPERVQDSGARRPAVQVVVALTGSRPGTAAVTNSELVSKGTEPVTDVCWLSW